MWKCSVKNNFETILNELIEVYNTGERRVEVKQQNAVPSQNAHSFCWKYWIN